MAKKTRPPKTIPVEEVAAVLACAELHTDKVAAQQFNVSERTIQRRRREMLSGDCPELASLVAAKRREATKRCQDLLTETFEHSLKRLQQVLPAAECRDVVGAVKILGELQIVKKSLGVEDDEQPGATEQSEPSAQDAGGTRAGSTGVSSPAPID